MENKYLVAFPIHEEERILRPIEEGSFATMEAAKDRAKRMSDSPHCWGTPYFVVNTETQQILWLYLFGQAWAGFMDDFTLTDEHGRILEEVED